MNLTDDQLRALVREAVARHLGGVPADVPDPIVQPAAVEPGHHASHAVYRHLVNVGDACLIEPSVECTHCNYCKSHGH